MAIRQGIQNRNNAAPENVRQSPRCGGGNAGTLAVTAIESSLKAIVGVPGRTCHRRLGSVIFITKLAGPPDYASC